MRTDWAFVFYQLLHLSFSEVDWCDFNCGRAQHVRCGYRLLERNELCRKIESGMEPSERKEILDAHNRWRDFVASGNPANFTPVPSDVEPKNFIWDLPSSDMQQLTWDYDLERNARIWVSQCTIASYRPYFCAQTEKIKVVHMNKDDEPQRKIINGTLLANHTLRNFLNFINYTNNYADKPSLLIPHYKPGVYNPAYAMIFSKTNKLGCSKGICHCDQPAFPFGAGGSVICIYGPSFDHTLSGYKIYENGTACSACPAGTSCNKNSTYPHLCARPEDPSQPVDIPDANLALHAQPLNLNFALVILVVALF